MCGWYWRARHIFIGLFCFAFTVANARGDGTETLGPPSIVIEPGTGIVTAGVGMAARAGTIDFDVPQGVTIRQVLLYWSGFAQQLVNNEPLDPQKSPASQSVLGNGQSMLLRRLDLTGPSTDSQRGDPDVLVNNIPVVGTLIGGPTLFVQDLMGSTYRADITSLGLVAPGPNSLTISDLVFTIKSDGAGVLVIYDDPAASGEVSVRDGCDLAFNFFDPPLDTTVPQTMTFAPAQFERMAKLHFFVGDVDNNRPSSIVVTVGSVVNTYLDYLTSNDGPEWDTVQLPVAIAPGDDELTVQILSDVHGTGEIPASFAWNMVALELPDGLNDCDGNDVPDECDLDCEALAGQCQVGFATECGLASDCNNNGLPDACDLTDNDCNNNGIPDSCEPGGGACNDGDPCTINDFCSNGVCSGVERDCSHLDSTCQAGVCNPNTGACDVEPANTGGDCDDGELCTVEDFCWNGACVGFEMDCTAMDGECSIGACNPASGACEPIAINENAGCNDGDPCTLGETCQSGECLGAPKDCSSEDDTCNVGVCNPVTGVCEPLPANDGAPCNDGDNCTVEDFCSNGLCVAYERDCSAVEDACNVGVCVGTSGICEPVPANEGGLCDDGDACTVDDACTGGGCVGDPKDCSQFDDACNVGLCIGTTGVCVPSPAIEAGGCDDGDACTINDSCTNGICAGEPVDCSHLDDACNVGVCVGSTGICEAVPRNEGGTCDDGDACTINDACASGVCEGTLRDCSSLDAGCTLGVCNPSDGSCFAQPVGEGGACNDGDGCTVDDTCVSGVCAGLPKDCSGLDGSCNTGVCVGTSGVCVAEPANEGGACDDGNGCSVSDACSNGACIGVGMDCSSLDDACNAGFCVGTTGLCDATPTNEGGTCDDGDRCTIDDACATGNCAGVPVDCSHLDDDCNVGACEPTTGGCLAVPRNEGGSCDDGDDCTVNDACNSGVCSGSAKDCSAAGDACNVGVCVGTSGVCVAEPANEGGACDDGDNCSTGDACSNGVCVGAQVDCSGFDDACNAGFCDGASGLCDVTPVNEGGSCNDGDLCTIDDACAIGSCTGVPVDCSHLDDDCNVGVCEPTTGGCIAVPRNEGGACDDGNGCTVNDACNSGICEGVTKDCSASGDVCNTGVCIGTTGVCEAIPANEGAACDDSDGCTQNDVCNSGTCAGTPLDCSAFDDACNAGVCVGTSGVCSIVPANEGGSCDDGDACTVEDVCSAGACGGVAKDCSGLDDACNVGVCAGLNGACVAVPANDGGACDDGLNCTIDDACSSGACTGDPMPCPVGEVCDEVLSACVLAPAGRVSSSNKGSVLIFSDVELRWNSAGELIRDTFVSLGNDYPQKVLVQMYFIHGDGPLDAITSNAVVLERAHPGWNRVDVEVGLTANQPSYWAASTGTPIAGGIPPWTILDPGSPPGRPDPDGSGDRVLRGYIIAWAVDSVGAEIRWNHLSGSTVIADYANGTAWEFEAYAFQAQSAAVANGSTTGTPGVLNFDGVEYDHAYGQLIFDFLASGTSHFGTSPTPIAVDTDLTLHTLSADLRQETGGPVTTKASFTIWNQNEVKFTGLDQCVTCWDQRYLSDYGAPNHFLRTNLQTDRGKARVDGLASQLCNRDYDQGDVCTQLFGGPAPNCDPRDRVSEPAALLGVIAKELTFSATAHDVAAHTIGGLGSENAVIQVDIIGSPPPERSGDNP
ncbi:MAG: hypothetical protein H6817_08650 [Phycisphaerales bacterium]|nr:hypothetical protein [Phycisphaerales bacterium]